MNWYRRDHIIKLLNSFNYESPLDLFLRQYFLKNKSIGSHDRKFIADSVYDMIRYNTYLEYRCKQTKSWNAKLDIYSDNNFKPDMREADLPLHIKYSFPLSLVEILQNLYGKKLDPLLDALNQRAPLTIRVNTLKTSANQLLHKLKDEDKIGVRKCTMSPIGIQLISAAHINLFGLKDFQKGSFEVQDEASQLTAIHTKAQPGSQVLDYCAGAGGKSLAIACLMENKGQLYLHDIRPAILNIAKRRLKRAGVENAQIGPELNRLKGKMDTVLVDAPCTGTGTIRRNPDIKWKFSLQSLQEMRAKQISILSEAVRYLKPNGQLVYSTCSLLPQENYEVVGEVCSKFNLVEDSEPLQTSPLQHSMDGFFCIRLKYKS
jgi:16S rRNA (cytosine967-C5)-methyltransferase